MPSQNPPHPPPCDSLERLLANVRGILARHPQTFDVLARLGGEGASAHADIEQLRDSTSASTPPPQDLTDALRSPAGRDKIINLTVGGKLVKVAIPPLGYVDVRVEQEVWRVIQRTAMGEER